MSKDRKAWNSTLRPMSLKKQAELKGKKPPPRTGIKKKSFGASVIERLLGEGKVFKASSIPVKPRKKIRSRAKNNPGWWDVALEIWDERKRDCEVCGYCMVDKDPMPIFFSHLLERGSYRSWKRVKRNIRIKCEDCHRLWHEKTRQELEAGLFGDARGWKQMFALKDELKAEANGVQ